MNVLIVHEVSYESKVVYEYQEYAERLSQRGHNVTVIDFDESRPAGGERMVSRTGVAAIRLRSVPFLNLPLLKFVTARAAYRRALTEAIKEGLVDVVFLYSVAVTGTPTIGICSRLGIPVVYRVIDAYHKLRQNRWITLPLYLGERFIYRRADVICLLNAKLSGYVDRVAGCRCAIRTTVLNPGVDTTLFAPRERDAELAQEFGIADGDRVALFVGSLYPFAGVDAVVSNFGVVLESCPTAKIVVVGDGPLFSRLKALREEFRLHERIVLTGRRPFTEIPRWLSLAHVAFTPFYLNDVTRDIVPIKLLQYLASGTPVVSTPLPDVVRLFPQMESGVLYQSIEDPAAYAGVLGRLLADEALRSTLGAAGSRVVRAHWSLDATVTELERLLADVTRRSRGTYQVRPDRKSRPSRTA